MDRRLMYFSSKNRYDEKEYTLFGLGALATVSHVGLYVTS